MKNTRLLVLLALFVAQAMILSIIETLIPIPQIVPGVKLGLANIVSLIVIVFFGFKEALAVVLVRCALSSVMGGGLIVFFFSAAGGLLSTVVMYLLYKRASKMFSLVGVSVAGSISHNIGQLTMASISMRELAVFSYLPVLLISGIIMGCFVGFCSKFLTEALKRVGIFNRS